MQICIAVFLCIVGYMVLSGGSQEAELLQEKPIPLVVATEVRPGLKRTFSATGEVQAEKSANFIAEFKATVDALHVQVGDRVIAGQSLVTLQSPTIAQQVSTAQAYYVNTSQNLEQTRITGQQRIDEAEIALKTSQVNLEKLLQENAARRRQAEEALKSAELSFSLTGNSAQTAVDNAVRKTDAIVIDALTDADEILEYSQSQQGLTYTKETHIGVYDPAQKQRTIDALTNAYTEYQTYIPSYETSIALLKQTEQALSMLLVTLSNSVTSPEFSQATLNGYINNITSRLSSLRTQISELESAKVSLDSALKVSNGTSQVIIDAQAQYDTTIAQLEASEEKARLEVERAQGALDSARASARASEISAQANLNSAYGDFQQARISRDKLTLLAPFEGVVTELPLRVGREVQAGDILVAVEDATTVKIATFLSAEEAKSIAIGNPASIEGGGNAVVSAVAPTADAITKKYAVELRMEGESAPTPGSFVTVTFTTESQDNGETRIFLPVTSVHVSAAETFVWGVQQSASGASVIKKEVVIGELVGKFVEIQSGVSEGEYIVTSGGRLVTAEGQSVRLHQELTNGDVVDTSSSSGYSSEL